MVYIILYILIAALLIVIRSFNKNVRNKDVLFIPLLWPIILAALLIEFIGDLWDLFNIQSKLEYLCDNFQIPAWLDNWMTVQRNKL